MCEAIEANVIRGTRRAVDVDGDEPVLHSYCDIWQSATAAEAMNADFRRIRTISGSGVRIPIISQKRRRVYACAKIQGAVVTGISCNALNLNAEIGEHPVRSIVVVGAKKLIHICSG